MPYLGQSQGTADNKMDGMEELLVQQEELCQAAAKDFPTDELVEDALKFAKSARKSFMEYRDSDKTSDQHVSDSVKTFTKSVLDVTFKWEQLALETDFEGQHIVESLQRILDALALPALYCRLAAKGDTAKMRQWLHGELEECLYWRAGALLYMYCYTVSTFQDESQRDVFAGYCMAGAGYLELMLSTRPPLNEEEFESSDKGQVAQLLHQGVFSDTHMLALMYSGELCFWRVSLEQNGTPTGHPKATSSATPTTPPTTSSATPTTPPTTLPATPTTPPTTLPATPTTSSATPTTSPATLPATPTTSPATPTTSFTTPTISPATPTTSFTTPTTSDISTTWTDVSVTPTDISTTSMDISITQTDVSSSSTDSFHSPSTSPTCTTESVVKLSEDLGKVAISTAVVSGQDGVPPRAGLGAGAVDPTSANLQQQEVEHTGITGVECDLSKPEVQEVHVAEDSSVSKSEEQKTNVTEDSSVSKSEEQKTNVTKDSSVSKSEEQKTNVTEDSSVSKSEEQETNVTEDSSVSKSEEQETNVAEDSSVSKSGEPVVVGAGRPSRAPIQPYRLMRESRGSPYLEQWRGSFSAAALGDKHLSQYVTVARGPLKEAGWNYDRAVEMLVEFKKLQLKQSSSSKPGPKQN